MNSPHFYFCPMPFSQCSPTRVVWPFEVLKGRPFLWSWGSGMQRSALDLREHRPRVYPPWAPLIVSFSHIHTALCLNFRPISGPSNLSPPPRCLIQGFGSCSPWPWIHQQQLPILPHSWEFPDAKPPSWGHHYLIARKFNYLLNWIFKQTPEVMYLPPTTAPWPAGTTTGLGQLHVWARPRGSLQPPIPVKFWHIGHIQL